MSEDDRKSASEDGDEESQIVIPSRESLPLPPEVQYKRPELGRRPGATDSGDYLKYEADKQNVSAPVRYSAGMAGGVSLASSIIAGYWIGDQIEKRWVHETTPWVTIVMVLAGTGLGFYNMFRLLNRAERMNKK